MQAACEGFVPAYLLMAESPPKAFSVEHAGWMAGLLQALLRPEHQAQAARVIETCEVVPGYMQLVVSLAAESSTPLSENVRLIAIICCRNFVRRHWSSSKHDRSSTDERDKIWIRERCLRAALSERSDLHATQWALLVAKITRADWPKMWPSCFSLVAEACKASADALSRHDPASQDMANADLCVIRSARLLLEMLSDVASKTLPHARAHCAALCAELVGSATAIWSSVHSAYLRRLHEAADAGALARGAAIVLACARLARGHRSWTKTLSLILRSTTGASWSSGPGAATAVIELGRGLASLLGARRRTDAGVYAPSGGAGSGTAASACDKAASTLSKAALALQVRALTEVLL